MAAFALSPRYRHRSEKRRVVAIVLPILVGQGCEEQWQVYARHESPNEKFALCGCFKTIGFDCLENFKDGLTLCVSRLLEGELIELVIHSLDFNGILVSNIALSQQLKMGETVDLSASLEHDRVIHRSCHDNFAWKTSVDRYKLDDTRLGSNAGFMLAPVAAASSVGSPSTFNTSRAAALLTGLNKSSSFNLSPGISSPASTPPSSDRRHPTRREDRAALSQFATVPTVLDEASCKQISMSTASTPLSESMSASPGLFQMEGSAPIASVSVDSSPDRPILRKRTWSECTRLPKYKQRAEMQARDERQRLDSVATATVELVYKTLTNAVESKFARKCIGMLEGVSNAGTGEYPVRKQLQSVQDCMPTRGVGNSYMSEFPISSVSGYGEPGGGKGVAMAPPFSSVTGSVPFLFPTLPTDSVQVNSAIYFDEPCPQCPQTVIPGGPNAPTSNAGILIGDGDDDWLVPYSPSSEPFEDSSALGDLNEDSD